MKKYLSIMLLVIAAVFVSCGDDKDEPKQPEIPTMSTEYLKGRAYQQVGNEDYYLIFTKAQKMITFKVRENEKTLWLYTEHTFSVKTIDESQYLVYPRLDGEPDNQYRIWFDYTDKWHNYSYSHIVIRYDYGGYLGTEERTYKQVGTADEILAKYSSYTKD